MSMDYYDQSNVDNYLYRRYTGLLKVVLDVLWYRTCPVHGLGVKSHTKTIVKRSVCKSARISWLVLASFYVSRDLWLYIYIYQVIIYQMNLCTRVYLPYDLYIPHIVDYRFLPFEKDAVVSCEILGGKKNCVSYISCLVWLTEATSEVSQSS